MKKFTLALCAALVTLTMLLLSGCGGQHIPVSPDLSSGSVGSVLLSSASSSAEPLSSEPASSSTVTSAPSTTSSSPAASTATSKPQTVTSKKPAASSKTETSSTPAKPTISTTGFHLKGLWISCFEMPFTKKDTAATAKAKVESMMKTVAKQGYNAVFCHVRPFADAFYPSEHFPHSKYVSGTEGVDPGYDALQLMLDAAHRNGMQFHAWINPYRVSTSTTKAEDLSSGNIAAKWLTDGSGRAVASGNGIYLNPASLDAQELVIDGVKEIINKYDVDGIHFDDYFYPTTSKSFDAKAYGEYTATAGANPLSLADWRRANVNALVSAVYRACKSKKVTFGISPAADIEKNRNSYYADVAMWMANPGYIDYIIPQIYFGYEHPVATARYSYLLNRWCGLTRHSNLQLYIGLGAYRMSESSVDDYAEWSTDATLLAKQAKDAKTAGTGGFVVFSYAATTNANEHHQQQIKNLFSAIK